jgi:hypothetical protein
LTSSASLSFTTAIFSYGFSAKTLGARLYCGCCCTSSFVFDAFIGPRASSSSPGEHNLQRSITITFAVAVLISSSKPLLILLFSLFSLRWRDIVVFALRIFDVRWSVRIYGDGFVWRIRRYGLVWILWHGHGNGYARHDGCVHFITAFFISRSSIVHHQKKVRTAFR